MEESILDAIRKLPPEKQREVLDFADFLRQKLPPARPRQSIEGLWADLDVRISEEDIDEARRDMWGGLAGTEP